MNQPYDRVHGIMIEVNRDLYKDDIAAVKRNISHWLTLLVKDWDEMKK